MPARKRRLGVSAQERVFVKDETDRLRQAAARGAAMVDKLERTREAAAKATADEPASTPQATSGKGWWPFGRKSDPVKDRAAEIMAELEAAVRDRPQASVETATEAHPPRSPRKLGSAA